jgi:dCMP deaminase
MTVAVVAYIPVLHEGYRRFFEGHSDATWLFLITPELCEDYRPLAKDVRALSPELVATAIRSWGLYDEVRVLTPEVIEQISQRDMDLILPDEDVSYQVVERYFPKASVHYASAFLRWDKTKTVKLLEPTPAQIITDDHVLRELSSIAEEEATRSVDWWRQVGAAIRLADGTTIVTHNDHMPHPHSHYAVGDPRSNFFKGVHLELSTVHHAESALIAEAARHGFSTEGAVMYVTDFPCPPCAKLIAGAGVKRLYYREGYAVLDGEDVLTTAGVELVQVKTTDDGRNDA